MKPEIEYAPPVSKAPPSNAHLHRAAALLLISALSTSTFGCFGATISSLDTPSLQQPVPTTLLGDDGAPAPVPVPGARSTVFHFWSASCEPCRRTIPAVVAKRAEMQQKGATLVLVAVLEQGQTANDAKATLGLWGIEERFVIDMEGAFLRKVGAKDLPAFAIVDSSGVLRWVAPDGVTISNILASIPE